MKRYYSVSDYCRDTYGEKLYKLSLSTGFTCPNRDGTTGTGGCAFCTGAGEFSEAWIDIINGLSIPVVISSRIDDGVITKDNLLCGNTVAANNLSPQKAAILLRLALTGDAGQETLEKLFLQY